MRTLVVRRTEERGLVGRSLRALAAAGVVAEDAGADLASALAGMNEPIWLVGAGAWPIHPGPIPSPPPSVTGRPLVAFESVSAARRVDPSDRPASLYLEVDPARELAQRLTERCDFDAAARDLLAGDRWRVVRFAPLDVRDDPGLRVVQVVTSLQRGGAERLTLNLSTELGRRGVACLLVTIGRPTRQAFAMPKGAVELAPLALDRTARAEALGQLARAFAADVIHGHLIDAEDAARIAAQRIPLVLTIHNQRPGWPDGLSRLEAGHAALLVACARAVESELIAAGLPVPVRVVWNGIDLAAHLPTSARRRAAREFRRRLRLDPQDFVLLVLANPRPQKRLDRLPDVLAAARTEFARRGIRREARLVIAGEASPSNPAAIRSIEAVRARVDRLGLAEHVRWVGPVADVAAALSAADVLISTSDYEGLSLAQLEALAAGVPVVATDAGGVGELAPGDPAVAVLSRDVEPEQFATVLAERAVKPIPATLPVHFTSGTMAARHTWLYTRAIAAARPRRHGDGLTLITNNLFLGGAQTRARRLLAGMAARHVRTRAAVLEEEPGHATPGRSALLAAGISVLALPPAGSIDAAENVARLLGHLDDDPRAAVLLWAEGLPVEWLGGLDGVPEFLRDLDIFVLVAEPAGCPNASLEAMAAGLPVIATDVGGMAEQVEDGVTGRLVGRDSPEDFAAAVVEAACDRNLRVAWGEAGKRRVAERFGLERMIADYRRVCLDGPERAPSMA